MLMERELTMDERVKELKAKFTKMGIAEYHSSTCEDEYESLASYIREKDSFRYAFVVCPYTRSKNIIFRLMKIDIWHPSLPMGDHGSKGFIFDYMGEDPLGEAMKIAGILMGQKYVGRKIKDESCFDRASFRKISETYVYQDDKDKAFLSQRNYVNLVWPK